MSDYKLVNDILNLDHKSSAFMEITLQAMQLQRKFKHNGSCQDHALSLSVQAKAHKPF